ncbi:hypothetical protein A33Q_2237 [Indibacter alkaliphilus LW1]|uniref:Uncharacterized protein n=1 Tax=Indibacter alkaliphilus (strain CCUG 57479 / KCTC 22604 / LW1) TaxID=1189612 RepID=S2DBA8_INDAL|nr:hypothetical protein A33Q_2237 [Indibacter alkaliphilus LW1]
MISKKEKIKSSNQKPGISRLFLFGRVFKKHDYFDKFF